MNMTFIVVGIVVLAIVAFGLMQGKARAYPYVPAGPLLSAAELKFYQALISAVGEHQSVVVKIRVADIIKVKDGIKRGKQQKGDPFLKAHGQIAQKHVDFAVVDKSTFAVMAAVELDDASHRGAKARESDKVKDKSFEAAGVPLIRVPARSQYDSNALALQIMTRTSPEAAAPAKAGAVPGRLAERGSRL